MSEQNVILQTPLAYLKGVGPALASLLATELGLHTFGDLLHHFPFRYVDRTQITPIDQLDTNSDYAQVKGTLGLPVEEGPPRKRRMRVSLTDATGRCELVWFQQLHYIRPRVITGTEVLVFGKPQQFRGTVTFAHPEFEPVGQLAEVQSKGLQPVYSSTEKLNAKGMSSRGLERIVANLIPRVADELYETLPTALCEAYRLISRKDAYIFIHRPPTSEALNQAQRRLKFEELFFLQLSLLRQKHLLRNKIQGYSMKEVGTYFNAFYKQCLPFELTGAQKRVVKEIRHDMATGGQMNRLLQGDVGSGKTLVALLCALICADNGYQTALMAPTEILAQQHAESLAALVEPLGFTVALLTGSARAAYRRELHARLQSGEVNLLIGTHALLEDTVKFANLGLAIIDEQHRFGVAQRARFWKKNKLPPHILVMTATPIPRTLAMSVYGDLDVSVIDELPPGRKPIKTVHKTDANRLAIFGFMREQIALGRQIYVVYPLIEESEKLDLKSLQDGYESISRAFPLPDYRVSIVHGKMKAADKDYEMARFVKGETQIMVATTVIEVGVNVPNASVMVIENAERFGLSQLHQLRGRVGRGADQSFCILVTGEKLGSEARQRMKVMTATNDGFRIAEEDLRLRGPGDLLGTQQSGVLDMRIASLATDQAILTEARMQAQQILEHDPELQLPEYASLRQRLVEMQSNKTLWARIS